MAPRLTRREALSLSSAAFIGLSGCGARGSEGAPGGAGIDGEETATATERTYANEATSPDSRTVRNPDGNPAVRSATHEPGRDGTSTGNTEPAEGWGKDYWFVTTSTERDALEFSGATSDTAGARAFVTDTDLSEATLLVEQYWSKRARRWTSNGSSGRW